MPGSLRVNQVDSTAKHGDRDERDAQAIELRRAVVRGDRGGLGGGNAGVEEQDLQLVDRDDLEPGGRCHVR